jgi:hypothetical protein
MDMMIRLRTARRLAWLLASAIAIPNLSVAAMAAPKSPAPPAARSVVVFPMESAADVTNANIGEAVNTQLRDALSTYPGYRVVIYSERLPAVQRLVAMQPEKKSLISGPFTSDEVGTAKAMALGKAMSADLLVVGAIEKYSFNDTVGTADVTVSVQLIDAVTGKVVQTVNVTGRGVGKTTRMEGASEAAVQRDAIKDAVRKLMKVATGMDYQVPVQGSTAVMQSNKSKKMGWVPLLLVSLGVGLLLGGTGGHGSSGSSGDTGGADPPPGPPGGL